MQNTSLVIRPYDAATDLKTLSDIWFDASLAAHPFLGEALLIEQRRLIEETYLPQAETWVACLAGEAVGFISLLGTFIGGIFIAPDRQGHGIGRQLIADALARKRELSLEVYTANDQAVRFYAALGFQELSRSDMDGSGLPFPTATMRLQA